jgi:hypothetical protein
MGSRLPFGPPPSWTPHTVRIASIWHRRVIEDARTGARRHQQRLERPGPNDVEPCLQALTRVMVARADLMGPHYRICTRDRADG